MLHCLTLIFALGGGARTSWASARADVPVRLLAERLLQLPYPSDTHDALRMNVERQRLLAEIYVQAVVEVRGPGARAQLRALLERGSWPGLEDERLPSIQALRNEPGLFFFLFVLTQREPEVARLAFDVLATQGPRFHDDRPFGEIFAHFVAQCSRSPEHLAAGLDIFDRLFALGVDGRPAPLAEELSSESSNPFLASDVAKAAIVRNLALELNRRHHRTKAELLGALAAIDTPVTEEIARAALNDHPDALGVTAVLEGLGRGKMNPDTWRVIAANLPRYAAFSSADEGRTLATAARTLLKPFVRNDPAAVALADLLPQLFTSEFAPVRRLATRAIHWTGLSDAEARAFHERLLHDPQEIVRRAAVEVALPEQCDGYLRPPT